MQTAEERLRILIKSYCLQSYFEDEKKKFATKIEINQIREEISSLATVDETKKLFLATKESLGKMQKQISDKLAEK